MEKDSTGPDEGKPQEARRNGAPIRSEPAAGGSGEPSLGEMLAMEDADTVEFAPPRIGKELPTPANFE